MTETETNDRPKWLLELENRKRKPRLAHEAGAGAPCVLCKTACPGLDLHFWRKICKNCKCNKDDHDVDDEDFPQFDLLFGSSRKYKKKPMLLHISNEKGHSEEAFEWVPPDTTKELATDYMKALPTEKLPIKGSAGAAVRRQLLQKQLPLHDIDYKVCDELSEQEQKQFEQYLENIRKYVGQGTVTKILSARPFDRSLMTPANATDMQSFSPQHKPNVQATMVQLRTPSSFTPKGSYKHELSAASEMLNSSNDVRNIPVLEKYNLIGACNRTVKSEAIAGGVYNKGINQTNFPRADNNRDMASKKLPTTGHLKYPSSDVIRNVNSEVTSPLNPVQHYKDAYKDKVGSPFTSLLHSKPINDDAYIAESMLTDVFRSPSTAYTNDIIGSTLDKEGLMFIREKLSNKYSKQENQGQVPYAAPSFTRDLDSGDALPKNSNTLSQNVCDSKRADVTVTSTIVNNPCGTLTVAEAKIQTAEGGGGGSSIEPKPIKEDKEVLKSSSQVIQSIPLNSMSVSNMGDKEKLKEHRSLSPQPRLECTNEGKLSSFMTPATVIFSEKLQNQIFPCETTVTSSQPMEDLSNIRHLKGAMEELTVNDPINSQKCHKCEEEIRIGDVAVITEKTESSAWHPGCFVCNVCDELLVDLVYFYYRNKLYCGRDLAMLLGIPRCFACDELIFVREYTVAEGQNYHVKHFCCWDCDVPLAGKQYITENDRPLCLPCYQKTYAKTCNMCEKVIAADQQGVAVKDLNFHATSVCFCCYICNKNLLHGRMAVKEKKLFCSKECISKFLHPQI
ncbi:testin LIM domain protein [Andrena cerasifolii]|uniref:testin LIM domain protein n=1 Tax=Andrena cerasifolii TaxID=2819439 RepID=UPI0040378B25